MTTVLVELGVVEQRFQAVLEVLNEGSTVTDGALDEQGRPQLRGLPGDIEIAVIDATSPIVE